MCVHELERASNQAGISSQNGRREKERTAQKREEEEGRADEIYAETCILCDGTTFFHSQIFMFAPRFGRRL